VSLSVANSHIDRKVAEGLFRELLGERPVYRVLNIYGKSGMGKSYFKNHIKSKYLENYKQLIYVELDFEYRLLHKSKTAIMRLAKELEKRYGFNFMALWKAYAILWQKRYEHSPLMYASDLPYFNEIKKLVKPDKKGNIIIEIAKGLFGDRVSKELEELKQLDTQAIESRLYKFFVSDLRNIIKNSDYKDCIIVMDNIDLLKEHSNATPCAKDEWIRELITSVGKDAMFVFYSQEPLNWKECNSAWRDVVKSCKLEPFIKRDALRYISESDIKRDDLKEAISIASANDPFWLSIAKYAYVGQNEYTLPTNRNDIITVFIENSNSSIIKYLKVLSHSRFFTLDMLFTIAEQFGLDISDNVIDRLLSYNFVKKLKKDKYLLDAPLKQEFLKLENELEAIEYKSFMFSYYENILQSLDQELIKNTPELIDEAIEEAWYHLRLINDEPLVHFEWLDYYVSRFFMYAAWEPFVDRYSKIIPQLKGAQDDVSKEKLVSLYNNLAGLYESLGETKKSKNYYNKVIKLNRLELLSA